MSLSKSIIFILTLLTLVCPRVLVAPPGSSEEVGTNTREAVVVEATMERLLKKHKNFLKKRIGCADAGVQTNAHTELHSEPRALINSKNELHFHMIPVGKRDISDFKQKMQQKFPGSAASAFDFKIDQGADVKSVLLFYSND